jgi:hypothetical protein
MGFGGSLVRIQSPRPSLPSRGNTGVIQDRWWPIHHGEIALRALTEYVIFQERRPLADTLTLTMLLNRAVQKLDTSSEGAMATLRVAASLNPDFRFGRGTLHPQHRRRTSIFMGPDATNPATEGDTLWVRENPSRFSSLSTGF